MEPFGNQLYASEHHFREKYANIDPKFFLIERNLNIHLTWDENRNWNHSTTEDYSKRSPDFAIRVNRKRS